MITVINIYFFLKMVFFCSRRGEGFGFLKKVAYMENAVNCGDIGIYFVDGI